MKVPTFAEMKPRYTKLWEDMHIFPKRLPGMKEAAELILRNKDRYIEVCKRLGISENWWVMIGGIHLREGDCSFRTHLHNGDSLKYRTVHVPAGRPRSPAQPPFTWEQSAEDALRMRGLQHLGSFSVELCAYTDEGYNGWGYWEKGQTSSYDWAGTNDHAAGKFVADHVYSHTAVDAQEGTMPILWELMQLDPSVKAFVDASHLPQSVPMAPAEPVETVPAVQVAPKEENTPALNSVAPVPAPKPSVWGKVKGWFGGSAN